MVIKVLILNFQIITWFSYYRTCSYHSCNVYKLHFFHDIYICLLKILLTLQLNYFYSNFSCFFFTNYIESSPFSCVHIIDYVNINAIWPSWLAPLFRLSVPYQTSHFEIINLSCILLFRNRFSFSERPSFHLPVVWVLELCKKEKFWNCFFSLFIYCPLRMWKLLYWCFESTCQFVLSVILLIKKIQQLPSLYYHNFSLFTRIEFYGC
jgi:hypothetical protein